MNKSIGFIGFGKLGSVLSNQIARSNSVQWVVEKNPDLRNRAETLFNKAITYSLINEIEHVPDYIFLTVEDSAIEKTSLELSNHLNDKLKDCLVLHCSGALQVSILNSCKAYGSDIAVIHPYQTFYYPSENLLNGIGWTIRSSNRIQELNEFIKELGGIPYIINDDKMTLSFYHSSAVVASNFLNTLLSTSVEISKLAEIPSEIFIPQIVKTTIENNLSNNKNDFPLTGPFARADLTTIENHIQSLLPYPHLFKSYCYLALATIEIIKIKNMVDDANISNIESLLKKYLNKFE